MKKQSLFFVVCLGLFGLLPIIGTYGQEGFTGPGSNSHTKGQAAFVTVAAAKNLSDDARVTLQGNILRALNNKKYVFRDNTGEITIEIDHKVWRGLSVGENDRVEIYGEIEMERTGVEIEVKTIRKI